MILNDIISISQNPSSLFLKPYSLVSNSIYQITLESIYTLSSGSSSTSVFVTVLSGSVVTVIADGSVKQVQSMTNFTIDASKSYDEDAEVSTISYKYLTFTWSCVQIEPNFSPQCPIIFQSLTTPILTAFVPTRSANTTSRLTVISSDGGVRSSSAFIDVTATLARVSQLSVSLSGTQSQQNFITSQNLLLTGSLSVVESCNALWSVDDTQLELGAVALTPLYQNLAIGSKTTFQLLIASGSLPPRATLTFSLSCGNSKASITISTNGSPLPGKFAVTPPLGSELTTSVPSDL
jgi:hypothetical protein